MELHVETRGRERSADYRFLGDGPAESWWATGYGDRTAFERPTVLVERDEQGVRAYLGAIPSNRVDPAGATNRVSIVVEAAGAGSEGDVGSEGGGGRLGADDHLLLLALIRAWVDDIATGGRSVADKLDAVFHEDTVAALYGDGTERAEKAASLVLAAARALDEPATAATAEVREESWIAPIRSETGRAAFVRRAHDLLAGDRTGSAALVNLTDSATDFATEARTGVAVLVQDRDGTLDDEPEEIVIPPEEVRTTVGDPVRREKRGPADGAGGVRGARGAGACW